MALTGDDVLRFLYSVDGDGYGSRFLHHINLSSLRLLFLRSL